MEFIKNAKMGFVVKYLHDDKNQLWMKGKEIAQQLGYEGKGATNALKQHIPEEYRIRYEDLKIPCHQNNDTPTEDLKTTFITFPTGLSYLLGASKLEAGIKFRKWMYDDVMNSLWKTGRYELKPKKVTENHVMLITNEATLQEEVINFLRENKDKYHLKFVCAMGEMQDTEDKRITGWKMGYEKGMPDIIINNGTRNHAGLIIELKTPRGTGTLSNEQVEMIQKYRDDKYLVLVSNDYTKIILRLQRYFDRIRLPCRYCSHKFKTNTSRRNHVKYFHKK